MEQDTTTGTDRPAPRRLETAAGTGEAGAAEAGAGAALLPGARGAAGVDGRLRALIGLIDDPSPAVWEAVREQLEDAGAPALRELRRAATSANARRRARARAVLAERERRGTLRRLLRHAVRREVNLESALFLMAGLDVPCFDARPYKKALDAMADEVRRRAERESPGLARPMALVQYLAAERGYSGIPADFHHPDRIHLHRAIETRTGMPLTLTAIYLFVARRAGLRAAAVPLPGHVMLRLYGDSGSRSILVDPFHRGKLRTRRECTEYLGRHGLAPEGSWFQDADDGLLFLRHVMNLRNSYHLRGFERRAREVYRVAEVLSHVRGKGPLPPPRT